MLIEILRVEKIGTKKSNNQLTNHFRKRIFYAIQFIVIGVIDRKEKEHFVSVWSRKELEADQRFREWGKSEVYG